MAEANWVIAFKEQLECIDLSTEIEWWKKCSIYKVPAHVAELNKKAYRPKLVSFGPYHHGESDLNPMEEHKRRALLHFVKRSGKPFELFVDALREVVEVLQASYDELDDSWRQDTASFLQMMILDGCFMLEIFRVSTYLIDDYAPNDPIFSSHGTYYIMPYIRNDMLILENQLPILVLDKLIEVEGDKKKDENFINTLILKFCYPNTRVYSLGKCLHVLDVYRKSILYEVHSKLRRHRYVGSSEIDRSATELNEGGVKFKKSRSQSLKDISFRGGVLGLPVLVVDDTTEWVFLNVMAFERFHVGAGTEVTSYIFFMHTLLRTEKDVALLYSNGIILNTLESDSAVVKLFNSLSKDRTLDEESYIDVVRRKANAYCSQRWNEWRGYLVRNYFRSPWAIVNVIAAVILFFLTLAQTLYTVYPYYYSNEPPQRTHS